MIVIIIIIISVRVKTLRCAFEKLRHVLAQGAAIYYNDLPVKIKT
jgi:hypothetical protein